MIRRSRTDAFAFTAAVTEGLLRLITDAARLLALDFLWINAVDVFSIISIGQDDGVNLQDPASMMAAVLDFGNSITGAFSPGVPGLVWIPGRTGATCFDDYVARWIPAIAGNCNLVAIERSAVGDQRTGIDAIRPFVTGCSGSRTVWRIIARDHPIQARTRSWRKSPRRCRQSRSPRPALPTP